MHLLMRGIHIFEKPCCREIRAMRGLPVTAALNKFNMVIGNENIFFF